MCHMHVRGVAMVLHTDMPRFCNVMAGLFALQFGQLANKAFFCTRSDFLHPRHCNGFSPAGTSSFSLDIITAGWTTGAISGLYSCCTCLRFNVGSSGSFNSGILLFVTVTRLGLGNIGVSNAFRNPSSTLPTMGAVFWYSSKSTPVMFFNQTCASCTAMIRCCSIISWRSKSLSFQSAPPLSCCCIRLASSIHDWESDSSTLSWMEAEAASAAANSRSATSKPELVLLLKNSRANEVWRADCPKH